MTPQRWLLNTPKDAIQRTVGLAISFLVLMLFSDSVFAQVVEDNLLDATLDTYRTRMATITGNVGNSLVNTFYLLALIEFTWGMIKNYIDNGGLQGFLTEIITRILFIGFFLYLFQNGTQFPLDIANSFRDLAASVPGTGRTLTPDNVVDIGQNFMAQSWNEILSGNILSGLGMLIAAVIVFIAMVILAAHLTVALLEFYIVGYGGFVLLALGASRWTHGYAVSYLKYAMSVGMKLFVLLIIVAVVQGEMAAYLANVDQASITNVWAVSAFALFSVIIAIIAPQSVMGMMSGVSIASGAGVAAAAQTLGSAGGAAAGAASTGGAAVLRAATSASGVASAAKAATRLAGAAGRASGAGPLGSAAVGAGAVVKQSASSVAAAGSSALSKVFPVAQSAGGKLATRMNAARKDIE